MLELARGKTGQWRERPVKHLSERAEPYVINGDLGLRPKRMLYSPHYPRTAEGE